MGRLCGAKPGRRSAGWSSYPGEQVTCPKCLRKLAGRARLRDAKAEIEGARAADGVEDAAPAAAHYAGEVLALEAVAVADRRYCRKRRAGGRRPTRPRN